MRKKMIRGERRRAETRIKTNAKVLSKQASIQLVIQLLMQQLIQNWIQPSRSPKSEPGTHSMLFPLLISRPDPHRRLEHTPDNPLYTTTCL